LKKTILFLKKGEYNMKISALAVPPLKTYSYVDKNLKINEDLQTAMHLSANCEWNEKDAVVCKLFKPDGLECDNCLYYRSNLGTFLKTAEKYWVK
jgi:hypothetical protein